MATDLGRGYSWGLECEPTPRARAELIRWHTDVLRGVWSERHAAPARHAGEERARWLKLMRHYVGQQVSELRYLTDRPRKAFGPSHYGHGA